MFVPRSVKLKPPATKPATAPIPSASLETESHKPVNSAVPTEREENAQETLTAQASAQNINNKEVQRKRELATLVEVSLTDYTLWSIPELRQTVETQPEGWVPFETVIRHAPMLRELEESPNDLAQALRVHGSGRLELRLSLTKRSTRSGSMFDIRRKDWEALRTRGLRDMSEEDWNARTIYVENIPPPYYKSKSELVSFFEECLGEPSEPVIIQHISFPPKEGREENDTKCRGFAFIVCNTPGVATNATQAWSWTGVKARFRETLGDAESTDVEDAEPEPEPTRVTRKKVHLAKRCGFRAISYRRWTELRDEYLAYRKVLIAKMNSRPGPDTPTDTGQSRGSMPMDVDECVQSPSLGQVAPVATNTKVNATRPEYPPGCLVFVRNVHPGTNKTTLKKVLSLPFNKKHHDGSEIDYVDWTKGLDFCYVRVSGPAHADRMVHYFSKYVQLQKEPTDDKITRYVTPEDFKKRIAAELVTGQREEIYWREVPQKIKQAAVAKMNSTSRPADDEPQAEETQPPPEKRRKKNSKI